MTFRTFVTVVDAQVRVSVPGLMLSYTDEDAEWICQDRRATIAVRSGRIELRQGLDVPGVKGRVVALEDGDVLGAGLFSRAIIAWLGSAMPAQPRVSPG